MRVLYLVTKADLGGARVHILDLLHGFQSILDPIVAAGEEGYFTEAVRKLGLPCHIVPTLVHAIDPLRDTRSSYRRSRIHRQSHVQNPRRGGNNSDYL